LKLNLCLFSNVAIDLPLESQRRLCHWYTISQFIKLIILGNVHDIYNSRLATMLLIFLFVLVRLKDLKTQSRLLQLSKIKVYLQLELQGFAGVVSFELNGFRVV